jgi:hypothetical protein
MSGATPTIADFQGRIPPLPIEVRFGSRLFVKRQRQCHRETDSVHQDRQSAPQSARGDPIIGAGAKADAGVNFLTAPVGDPAAISRIILRKQLVPSFSLIK